MKKIITTLLISISFIAVSQDNGNNLVPNPSFEETGKDRVKSAGQIEMAEPWNSPTSVAADLYMENAKSSDYGVPNNIYGEEKARTGSNYAGIAFYGDRRDPRSYLQVPLLDTLKASQEYCIKFHVSMSDRAKYAVNNLAVYVSNEEVLTRNNSPLIYDAQVMNLGNNVFDKQFLWEPICNLYQAKGDETYIVIGNFNSDQETTQDKIRMSRDISGSQTANGYYYIDDVSVIAVNESTREQCMCAKIAGGIMKVEKSTFGTEEEKRKTAKTTILVNSDGSTAEESKAKEKEATTPTTSEQTASTPDKKEEVKKPKAYNVNDVVILFDIKSPKISAESKQKLDKIAEYLKNNKSAKVQVEGHADYSEEEVPFLGKRRAFAVVKYLTNKGVDKDRVPYKSFETELPVDSSNPNANARVTFSKQ